MDKTFANQLDNFMEEQEKLIQQLHDLVTDLPTNPQTIQLLQTLEDYQGITIKNIMDLQEKLGD